MNYREKFKRDCETIGVSMKKAISLYCYECSGYNYKEAANCDCKSCPLWIVRNNKKLKTPLNLI